MGDRIHDAGKGDNYRPVNYTKFRENYDRIFGKKTNETKDSKSSVKGKDRSNERRGS